MYNTSFDSIVADIIDNMAKQKDRAVAEAFVLQIGQLLRDNGIVPHFTETSHTETTYNKFTEHYGIAFDRLDSSEHDKEFLEEIEKLKSENAELHCELQAVQAFSDELTHEPIEVAKMLIAGTAEYGRNVFMKERTGQEKGTYNIYGISELRQIAEHLLVYCNNNKDEG